MLMSLNVMSLPLVFSEILSLGTRYGGRKCFEVGLSKTTCVRVDGSSDYTSSFSFYVMEIN